MKKILNPKASRKSDNIFIFHKHSLAAHDSNYERLGLFVCGTGHFRMRNTVNLINHAVLGEYNLRYCVDGEGKVCVGNNIVSVKKGNAVIVHPGLMNKYGCPHGKEWECYWVHFRGKWADDIVDLLNFKMNRIKLEIKCDPAIIRLFNSLLKAMKRKNLNSHIEASIILYDLLMTFNKLTLHRKYEKEGLLSSLVESAGSVDEMARMANMSKYHFIRKFKKALGISPGRFLLNKRLALAKELLCQKDNIPIKEISEKIGIGSNAYFSYFFRKETGMTPQKFRKQMIG